MADKSAELGRCLGQDMPRRIRHLDGSPVFTFQQTGMPNFDHSFACASRSVVGHERKAERNPLSG